MRLDLAAASSAPARPAAPVASRAAKNPPRPRERIVQGAAWGLAALGVAAVGVGLGLMGIATMDSRPELWSPGLAATITGQALVIVALAHVAAALWTAARSASQRLAQVHDEVRRLRRLHEEQAGRHAPSAAAFYAELARDAPPDRLLGSLQGQVDRLAARLATR